jgi:hypothetical protein
MSPSADRSSTAMLSAGLTWVVSVALLAYGGYWLDGRLGTTPWMLVVGALAGAVGGCIHFIAQVAPELLPFGRRGKSDGSSQHPDKPN